MQTGSVSTGFGFILGFFTALLLAVLANVVIGIFVWRRFKGNLCTEFVKICSTKIDIIMAR